VITLAAAAGVPAARHGHQRTSMPDRELDRVLQLLLSTGHVGARRTAGDGCCRWQYLRLRPPGLEAVGAWPAADERARVPSGCDVWDARDAPLLRYLAARGPLPVVDCAPTDGAPGARDPLFTGLPVTRVGAYWSLLALRDAELVSGIDGGEEGWRDVAVTGGGRELAARLPG
jgi:hypothetical protein